MGEKSGRGRNGSRSTIGWMLGVGALAAVVTAVVGVWQYAFSVGWAVACATYLIPMWRRFAKSDGEATRARAAEQDPKKTTSDTLLLVAALASILALGLLLAQPGGSNGVARMLQALLGSLSVALSWFFVHTLYTVRYAVLYYAEEEEAGRQAKAEEAEEARRARPPINFNQDQPPRYLDFAYVAFTVGMTFQISDTDLSSTVIRAAVLRHMLLSYLFGAVILAGAVNLVASLAQ